MVFVGNAQSWTLICETYLSARKTTTRLPLYLSPVSLYVHALFRTYIFLHFPGENNHGETKEKLTLQILYSIPVEPLRRHFSPHPLKYRIAAVMIDDDPRVFRNDSSYARPQPNHLLAGNERTNMRQITIARHSTTVHFIDSHEHNCKRQRKLPGSCSNAIINRFSTI